MKNIHKIRENIYITNSEEIKEGDWFISGGLVNKAIDIIDCDDDGMLEIHSEGYCNPLSLTKKIILTTDQDLIKNGVQAIDDEFLEWFVKNPSCESVEIANDTLTVKEMSKLPLGTRNHKYKIIIPQEEAKTFKELFANTGIKPTIDESGNIQYNFKATMKEEPKLTNVCIKCGVDLYYVDNFACQEHPKNCKGIHLSEETLKERALKEQPKQETLEEGAKKHQKNTIGVALPKHTFIEGAKWQQERSYSEKELRNKLLDINLVNPSHLQMTSNGHGEFPDSYKLTQKGIDYIIEQFKKK